MGLNEVHSLSLLTNNVCPLELEDKTNELVNMEHVDILNSDGNHEYVYDVKMLMDSNVEVVVVFEALVNAHYTKHVDLMNDHNQITIEVDSTLGVELRLDRGCY